MSSRGPLRPTAIDELDDPDDDNTDTDDHSVPNESEEGRAPLSFLERPPPSWADVEIVTIGCGERRAYDEEAWRRAMVVVERGEIGLECIRGGRRTFGAGAVLWTVGLDLVSLYNGGVVPVVLSVVQRRNRQND